MTKAGLIHIVMNVKRLLITLGKCTCSMGGRGGGGGNLADPKSSKKAYWKIMNRVTNKCKAPKIPPILSQ